MNCDAGSRSAGDKGLISIGRGSFGWIFSGKGGVGPMDEKGKRRKGAISPGNSTSGETVRMPITDTLDLHTFSPAELEPLLDDYLEACLKEGIQEVRIIHGKGRGVQRRRVQSVLSRSPLVQSYHGADPGGGSWGATIAVLKKSQPHIPNGQ